MLTLEQGKKLVKLARDSIDSVFTGKKFDIPKEFNEKQGIFVSIHKGDELRGCIGFTEPIFKLNEAVMQGARFAAFKDPRFIPLLKEEMEEITIEVSVLTKPEEIKVEKPEDYLNQIKIGKDGLIVKNYSYNGLLLPQVFPEYKANAKKALEMTCEKAGISKDAWKDLEHVKVFKFQAQIFTESDGKVVENKQ